MDNWASEMLKNYIFNLYNMTMAFEEKYYRKDRDITKSDFEDINSFLDAIEYRLKTLKEVINDESSDINRKIN